MSGLRSAGGGERIMSTCEKCWSDAGGNAEHYQALVDQRIGRDTCTPEQQAGFNAEVCESCNRKTVHQHTGKCVICGDKW